MIKLIDLLNEVTITPDDINRILKRTGEEQDLYEPDWEEFTPEVCNTGLCDVFAKKFREEYPGAELWGTYETIGFTMGHVWVKYAGKFYDAETPNGVNRCKDIPYVQRLYKINGEYPNDVKRLA